MKLIDILNRFDAFTGTIRQPFKRTLVEEKNNEYYSTWKYLPVKLKSRQTIIGYTSIQNARFIQNNANRELDYCLIMYPTVIVAFKQKEEMKIICMYLSKHTTYNMKNSSGYFKSDHSIRYYFKDVIPDLKRRATLGGVKYEEFMTKEFEAFMLLTTLGGD